MAIAKNTICLWYNKDVGVPLWNNRNERTGLAVLCWRT